MSPRGAASSKEPETNIETDTKKEEEPKAS